VGKPEGKKQPGRQRRRWKNGIRMNLGEIGWGGFNWLGTGAVVNAVMNLRVL
jgi:hypothetical protein